MVMVMVDIENKEEPSILGDRGNSYFKGSRKFEEFQGLNWEPRCLFIFINKNMWWEKRERRILYFGLQPAAMEESASLPYPSAFGFYMLRINGQLYWP
jgi:hypothetical protein